MECMKRYTQVKGRNKGPNGPLQRVESHSGINYSDLELVFFNPQLQPD